MKNKYAGLIATLAECAAACNRCSILCLEEKDVHKMATCIRLETDCAQICQLTAAFLSRNSNYAVHLVKVCAEICSACAQECAKHSNMEHCKICEELCKQCADMCLINAAILN